MLKKDFNKTDKKASEIKESVSMGILADDAASGKEKQKGEGPEALSKRQRM